MNLRTYVRPGAPVSLQRPAPGHDPSDVHQHPGIFFFSLDASNLPAVLGARIGFGLPYFWSDMAAIPEGPHIHYTSSRRQSTAQAELRYAPVGEILTHKSELERFLGADRSVDGNSSGAAMRRGLRDGGGRVAQETNIQRGCFFRCEWRSEARLNFSRLRRLRHDGERANVFVKRRWISRIENAMNNLHAAVLSAFERRARQLFSQRA